MQQVGINGAQDVELAAMIRRFVFRQTCIASRYSPEASAAITPTVTNQQLVQRHEAVCVSALLFFVLRGSLDTWLALESRPGR